MDAAKLARGRDDRLAVARRLRLAVTVPTTRDLIEPITVQNRAEAIRQLELARDLFWTETVPGELPGIA